MHTIIQANKITSLVGAFRLQQIQWGKTLIFSSYFESCQRHFPPSRWISSESIFDDSLALWVATLSLRRGRSTPRTITFFPLSVSLNLVGINVDSALAWWRYIFRTARGPAPLDKWHCRCSYFISVGKALFSLVGYTGHGNIV